MKNTRAVLIFTGSAILLIVIACIMSNIVNDMELHQHIKKVTTPLPLDTVAYLCKAFKLSETNRLCNGKADVYGPDFYPVIGDAYYPAARDGEKSSHPANYYSVEQILGRFKTSCEPKSGVINEEYVRCHYDLRGDGEFDIAIYFSYPTMDVNNIQTPMGMNN